MNFMNILKNESEESYNKQFRKWKICLDNNNSNNLKDLYSKIHLAIRNDPSKKTSNK